MVYMFESRPRPDVARRLASLMVSQKRGTEAPDYGKVAGRIDRRSLYKTSTGNGRIFFTQSTASPTRLRVVVLLDCSGSMRGERMKNGVQMVRDIIDATVNIPTVTCEVWGHTTGRLDIANGDKLSEGVENCGQGNFVSLVELWKPGATIDAFHAAVNGVGLAGNEDGWALQVLGEEVAKTARPGERLLYVVVSDGQPIYRDREAMLVLGHVKKVADDLRKRGAGVISVAIDAGLSRFSQEQMYGKGHYIVYQPNTNSLLRDIAKAISKALA